MLKPHWRCSRCDGSRYHIWENNSISCVKCGNFEEQITEYQSSEAKN